MVKKSAKVVSIFTFPRAFGDPNGDVFSETDSRPVSSRESEKQSVRDGEMRVLDLVN